MCMFIFRHKVDSRDVIKKYISIIAFKIWINFNLFGIDFGSKCKIQTGINKIFLMVVMGSLKKIVLG